MMKKNSPAMVIQNMFQLCTFSARSLKRVFSPETIASAITPFSNISNTLIERMCLRVCYSVVLRGAVAHVRELKRKWESVHEADVIVGYKREMFNAYKLSETQRAPNFETTL